MVGARLRLVSLWVSQTARVVADWCLRLVAFLAWARSGPEGLASAWYVATAAFIGPFVLLAPLNGCLGNALPRRAVLSASALFTLLTVAAFLAAGCAWMACLSVVALGSAVYGGVRFAVLPAAAVDTGIPLARVNGAIELGGAAGIVAGIALGWALTGPDWTGAPGGLAVALVGLNLLCLLTALPARFPSDASRPEPPAQAVAGFFRDTARIARDRPAAASLLGLAGFQALATAGTGALAAHTLAAAAGARSGLLEALALVGVGAALGCATAALQGHLRRSLGFVPLGAVGLLVALGWAAGAAAAGRALPLFPCLLLGFTGAWVNVPLRSSYLAEVPADARGNAMSVMNTTIYVLTTALALVLAGLAQVGLLTSPVAQLGLLAGLAGVAAVVAGWRLGPPMAELFTEWVLVPMYRVRSHGPGVGRIPPRGPLLVVANHAAYFDPFWLAKALPRHLTPMMTSYFYDRPVIRWLMAHVVGAIRVPNSQFRREAPELADAVAVLRRGGCVLVFPEGILRRRADQLVRPFGQGVWHILQELPETPVLACWIEGGWGSFASYDRGPPLANKRPDWARRIDIAFAEPRPLPAEVLADQRATRAYLQRACLECRRYLGLAVPDEACAKETPPAEEPRP